MSLVSELLGPEVSRVLGNIAASFDACDAKGAEMPEVQNSNTLPACIASIPTGSQAVLGTKTITANGTYNAVDDELDGYSSVTVAVEGTVEPTTGFRVRFFDYDGTLLKTEYVESGEDATPPTLPTHENLTFQEWNNPYTGITEDTDIGANYKTTDDCIYATVEVNAQTGLTLKFRHGGSRALFEWGDGETSYSSGSSLFAASHTYINAGRYIVKITPNGSSFVFGFNTASNGSFVESMYQLLQLKLKDGAAFTNYSFLNMRRLKSINIPYNCGFVYTSTFQNCSSLTGIVLPRTITSIGTSAFSSCYLLQNIIPNSVTSIGTSAFNNCYSLREIILPSGISAIQASTFASCYNLKKIVIEKDDAVVTLENINAFSNNNADLKIYVPDALVNDYKTATNWVTYASYIYPISTL